MKDQKFILFTLNISTATLKREEVSITNPDDDAIGQPYRHFFDPDIIWHVFIRKDGDISESEARDRLIEFVHEQLKNQLVSVADKMATLNKIVHLGGKS